MKMKIGVVFPQIEFLPDAAAVKDYAQTVEQLGFSHVIAYDHIVGANPDRPGGWTGPYTFKDPFLEPFVLFSFMAGFTQKLGFLSGIIILPQRQTVLAAKQAATLDVLSSGRLRMGVGLGWNTVEYEALGQDFHSRGKRLEEQVSFMRELWTKPLVTFEGRWDRITDAGLNPLPIQRPIPVWFGGTAEPALKRAARLGDGWLPNTRKPEDARPMLEIIHQELDKRGRSIQDFGIEARLSFADGDMGKLAAQIKGWEELGAGFISINTMGCSFSVPRMHLEALERVAKEIGLAAN
jgi:probable F420-dependent oxidoreductase